jgi:hypothetical protein
MVYIYSFNQVHMEEYTEVAMIYIKRAVMS